MTDARCEESRQLAPELALGVVDGEERGLALEHLAECADCRRHVERLSEVADELLLLAPPREVPVGFESRLLEPLRPKPVQRRGRRFLVPAAAAATALAIGVAATLLVVNNDLQLASDYRGALAEANGEYFHAGSLTTGEGRAGTAFAYQGSPSWMLVVVDPAHRAAVTGAELVTVDGDRIRLRSFALDPANGSWGGALPVDLHEVAVIRVLAAGEPLIAKLGD